MMTQTIPRTMEAAAIGRFGELPTRHSLPVPEIGPDEVLIRVESAGVGVWDPLECAGGFHELGMAESEPVFPYIPGSDGAGTVVAAGANVRQFQQGDRVYALSLLNPKGGFYAQYIALRADNVSRVPEKLNTREAGALPVDAITALQGLDDTLGLQKDESVMIFGASGGIGHLAVQLAKRMGARVFAVASGDDGVALAKRLGADAAVNGRKDDVVAAVRKFAPEGLDAALVTAGGDATDRALEAMRDGGRVAYPNGVEPAPKAGPGVSVQNYDGMPNREAIEKLNRWIDAGPFHVHIARTFSFEQAGEAHRTLGEHYLGKLSLQPTSS